MSRSGRNGNQRSNRPQQPSNGFNPIGFLNRWLQDLTPRRPAPTPQSRTTSGSRGAQPRPPAAPAASRPAPQRPAPASRPSRTSVTNSPGGVRPANTPRPANRSAPPQRSTAPRPSANINPIELGLRTLFTATPVLPAVRAAANFLANTPVGAIPIPGNSTLGGFVDSTDNFLRAAMGERGVRPPQTYSPQVRNALADAIDRGIVANRPTDDRNGFVPVNYHDYSADGNPTVDNDRFVLGRFMGRRNPDGTYEIRSNETYNYDGGSENKDMATAYQTIGDAAKRGDFLAVFSNSQDILSEQFGFGRQGFNVGGQFTRAGQELPPAPSRQASAIRPVTTPSGGGRGAGYSFPSPGGSRTVAPTPVVQSRPIAAPVGPMIPNERQGPANTGVYTVKRGDTLWDLSRQTGLSVEELARRNNISDPNMIGVGQRIQY